MLLSNPTSRIRAGGLFACAFALWGCSAGSGSGEVVGALFIEDCKDAQDRGTVAEPLDFDLGADFFAAEPIDDIASDKLQNRLLIRLQRSGARAEVNDSLYFDIGNVFEVARCVRGRVVAQPDGSMKPDFDTDRCFWSPDGPGRMRVGMRDHVRAFLLPARTCTREIVGVGVSCADTGGCADVAAGQWESFIEFNLFGSADQSDRQPVDRDPVDPAFTVDFGQRLSATRFQLTIEDSRVLEFRTRDFPVGTERSQIAGKLSGWFDFDLERDRAAQTFP